MSAGMRGLTPNGLIPHDDFPVEHYEAVHAKVAAKWSGTALYPHYSGAWNALAYRFHGSIDAGVKFRKSLDVFGAHPEPHQRFHQEAALFDFFSNGFAAFEALFYGLFVIGAFIDAGAFPLSTPRDQQRVSPSHTADAFNRTFADDPILKEFARIFSDSAYQRWREMRNVLTHRAAPGRRVYVGIGSDDAPPVEWKLNNLPLDSALVPRHQRELAQLTGNMLIATNAFLMTKV